MGSSNASLLTAPLLALYSQAALRNADELLVEAKLLYDHGHYARAYFLAFGCIEEAGKALLSFDSRSRNLSDPAVSAKLKASMENHSQKISYVLMGWALNESEPSKALKIALNIIYHLQRGREPSMYSDVRSDLTSVQTPSEVVRAVAARDCVELAKHILGHAHQHVKTRQPIPSTRAQDRFLTMKARKVQELLDNEDFWWFFLSRMENGELDLAEAANRYEHDHIRTGKPFRLAGEGELFPKVAE